MNPITHPTNNARLGAPANWDQSEAPCGVLQITQVIEDGLPAMHSWWRPSEDELLGLLAGGAIQLTVIGRGHPPVRLAVDVGT